MGAGIVWELARHRSQHGMRAGILWELARHRSRHGTGAGIVWEPACEFGSILAPGVLFKAGVY